VTCFVSIEKSWATVSEKQALNSSIKTCFSLTFFHSGTDVMILKIFSLKILAHKWRLLFKILHVLHAKKG
jgi:hypothetical protein